MVCPKFSAAGVPASPLSIERLTSFNLGEEYFNPVTGEETSPVSGKLDIGSPSLGEEYYHPVSGELETNNAGMNVSSFGMAEENFHPITGELE